MSVSHLDHRSGASRGLSVHGTRSRRIGESAPISGLLFFFSCVMGCQSCSAVTCMVTTMAVGWPWLDGMAFHGAQTLLVESLVLGRTLKGPSARLAVGWSVSHPFSRRFLGGRPVTNEQGVPLVRPACAGTPKTRRCMAVGGRQPSWPHLHPFPPAFGHLGTT
jgi:hypothetical protein